ncbi:hybrid sensor histidine kinase/response regulator [Arhodomonas aquaeolei]|uniref:hybrid sensor histidine kinase/response regulator n=1 Tax=Arhodomonas aquaeolei TaxID=2369 RepID=UPI0003745D6C|nr:hybrid sensor histidine kinase/response regulator [Arhodomonas aquaeolei]
MTDRQHAGTTEIERLRSENERLLHMVDVLMERAEQDQGSRGGDYALFETAAVLEETVKARTAELVEANRRLMDEIARRRSAEDELQRAKARAERASANKSNFLTAVSHDLQQPLTAARLLLQAIADSADDDEVLDLAASGQATLETMESLLGSLIDIAKLDSGVVQPQPTHFRLDVLLHRLGGEYRLHAESADLTCRVRCPPATVYSDPVLVERAVRNLLGNAVRYTRDGGILLTARPRRGAWRVGVYDTGPGIPEREQQRIFRGFYQLRNGRDGEAQGLGLGLTIVRMIAELIGAGIVLRSRPGHGSAFGITLPAGQPEQARDPGQRADSGAHARDLAGEEVLVVENDQAVMLGMATLLRQWGARVHTCYAPPERAPAAAATALIDYHLGGAGENGLEVATRLRGTHPGLRAVIVTSERGEWLTRQCRELGVELLHKPVDTARLRDLLQARR